MYIHIENNNRSMKNPYLILIICTITLILPTFQSFSQETPILAVTDISVDKRIESELSLPLTDRIREILVNSNQYQVIDRNTWSCY